jgi:hypothetical protein
LVPVRVSWRRSVTDLVSRKLYSARFAIKVRIRRARIAIKGEKEEWIPAAREFDGGPFRISYEYKEMVTYWEGDDGFVFECAWGVEPPILFVPSERSWDSQVPPRLIGRRSEVVDRLAKHSGHIVEEATFKYDAAENSRTRSR